MIDVFNFQWFVFIIECYRHQAKYSPPVLKSVSPKHNSAANLSEEINHVKAINEDDKLIQYLNNSSIDIDALQVH